MLLSSSRPLALPLHLRRRIHACHMRRRIHASLFFSPFSSAFASEEEDTCTSYEEEDTCMSYEEEDTCIPLALPLPLFRPQTSALFWQASQVSKET